MFVQLREYCQKGRQELFMTCEGLSGLESEYGLDPAVQEGSLKTCEEIGHSQICDL